MTWWREDYFWLTPYDDTILFYILLHIVDINEKEIGEAMKRYSSLSWPSDSKNIRLIQITFLHTFIHSLCFCVTQLHTQVVTRHLWVPPDDDSGRKKQYLLDLPSLPVYCFDTMRQNSKTNSSERKDKTGVLCSYCFSIKVDENNITLLTNWEKEPFHKNTIDVSRKSSFFKLTP